MSPTPLQRRFTLELLTEWRKLELPFANETLILAVSGGADSCALAAGVSELRNRQKLENDFIVAHFDHGLRGAESQEDSEFVKELSQELGFEFLSGSAPASVFRSKSNLEEKARKARYTFLRKAAKATSARYVLTAHTRNDQAETLLLNLVRGAGLSGLSGMAPVRVLGTDGERSGQRPRNEEPGILLARPMLNWATRETNRAYCGDCGISPKEDSMNTDLGFSRIRIRNQVIPLLEELNPRVIETIAASADTLRDENDFLSLDAKTLQASIAEAENVSLEVRRFTQMADAVAVSIVRRWIKIRRGSLRAISRKHLLSVVDLAKSGKSGRLVELPGRCRVVKRHGRLCFEDVKVEK
ncbi:MAG: tRNA lysidine(34) synthetase TilS [Acidobacteria bacterium]|nr:MAG: tRNA lysidine(34) synthetase TilS [Acidobacteriota bacterium]REK01226.1 MAG: tRNA lysidine(34) synthetase TilS [Acidobacteriota bacterium]REK14182.1 MAG: tRNA lysidine(34) synthetase TilS [Acidobacteriota bacterium]REK44897.1 MAG: tRNA lysidine(34) synthetase TilS [Acidobacteriota bacterium]